MIDQLSTEKRETHQKAKVEPEIQRTAEISVSTGNV